MRGHMGLAIVGIAGVPKRQDPLQPGGAELLIDEEKVGGAIIEIADAEAYVFAHLAFKFDVPHKRAGARLRPKLGSGAKAGNARRQIRVCQYDGLAHQRT